MRDELTVGWDKECMHIIHSLIAAARRTTTPAAPNMQTQNAIPPNGARAAHHFSLTYLLDPKSCVF